MYDSHLLIDEGIALPSSKKRIAPLLLLFTCLCFSLMIKAQSTIQGFIYDEGGKPIARANVSLMRVKDSLPIKRSATDTTGSYSFRNIADGGYFILATAVGFEKGIIHAFYISNMTDMNGMNLQLSSDSRNLNTVVIQTRKPLFEQKLDRMVINVKNSIASSGTTALEILERSPGVLVDRYNNTISMAGKQGVVILINGKVTNMPPTAVLQLLSGMNAGTIDKIELLTTPPANYDAEGSAGFINIVLVRDPSDGTIATLALSGGYGKGETSSAQLNLQHRKGKIYLFGDYSFSRVHQPQTWYNTRQILLNNSVYENSLKADRDPTQRDHNIRFGFEYKTAKKTTLGGLLAAYDNRWSMKAVNTVSNFRNGSADAFVSVYSSEINQWRHLMGNVHLQQQFKDDSRLEVDMDYLFYTNQNPTDYRNIFYDRDHQAVNEEEAQTRKHTPVSIRTVKADYFRKQSNRVQLEAGLKNTQSFLSNTVGVAHLRQFHWQTDTALTAVYRLKENVVAVYGLANMTLTGNVTLKAGLRYEYTYSNLQSDKQRDIVNRRYGNFFPSVFLNYKPRGNQSLGFSYSRRINRPGFQEMAPFVIFLDPTTYFSGNPALQPSVTDAFKTDYAFRRLMFSLSFSHEANAIARWQSKVVDSLNKQFIAAENFKSINTYSLMVTLPVTVNKIWSMQNSILGMMQRVNTNYKSAVQLSTPSFQLNSSQTLQLGKGIAMELSGYYRSKTLSGTYVMKQRGILNFGIQKKVNKGNGTLNVTVNDIFVTNQWRSYIDLPEQNLSIKTDYLMSQRTFRINYTFKFGKTDLKPAARRETGSEEEQKRMN